MWGRTSKDMQEENLKGDSAKGNHYKSPGNALEKIRGARQGKSRWFTLQRNSRRSPVSGT